MRAGHMPRDKDGNLMLKVARLNGFVSGWRILSAAADLPVLDWGRDLMTSRLCPMI